DYGGELQLKSTCWGLPAAPPAAPSRYSSVAVPIDSSIRLPGYPELGHTDAVVVLTTLASTEEAAKFVRALLDRRLVACGTILPAARSLYRWEDKLADETEVVVMLKTRSGAIHGLEKAFKELHPYKVPELLAVPVTGGLERYLGWINSETSLQIV